MTNRIVKEFESLHGDSHLLQGLTNVDFIRDLFSTHTFDRGFEEEIQRFEARILKKHLRKTIIRYTISFGNSTRNYIGLYRESDKRLGHSFSVLKTLRSNGFEQDNELTVPDPLLYLPALSFLMMEMAEGEPLREVFQRQDDLEPYVRGAARWLAKLHNSNVTIDGISSREDEIAASLRFTRAASWLFPRLSSEIQSISKQLIDAQTALRPRRRKPIHGDYHPRNIIASSGLTTVIDFEDARMGDPAFDLGYFVAQTKMTHGTGEAIIQATERFIQEYREHQPSIQSDFAHRVAVFEAQTYFQRIYHTYHLLALKPDLELVSRWLSECEVCLDRAGSRI